MSEQAAVSSGRRLSGVWIIPVLALLLGAYMVVHSWMTEGPDIEIAFKTAEGLEAGKTKIKYRNVDMGVIESVRLNDTFDGIIAAAKMERQALPLLRDDSRFWLVTARVGVGNVTGLDTLLSGAYIQLAPGTGEQGNRTFTAMEEPPLTPTDANGLRLQLTSDRGSSVSTGDAVMFNGYKVGRVESETFDLKRRVVDYVIFVDAPFHTLINSAVRFWDISGISLSAGADGFKVETGSLDTVILGGIAFGVPEGLEDGDPVEHNTSFKLYHSYEDILKNPFKYGIYYVVEFSQSIKGLMPGAPVEFRGLPIGRVERIMLKESISTSLAEGSEGKGAPIPVLIYIEPARLSLPDRRSSVDIMNKSIEIGIGNGMRSSLESGNLLTGAKYVSIDFYPEAEPATLGTFLEWPAIPSVETGLGQLQQKVGSILDMVANLPLDETVANANAAIVDLGQALNSATALIEAQDTQALPQQLNQTLRELRETLSGLSPDSEVYRSLNASLLRLNRTLSNLETVSGALATQPNAAIMPSSAPPDPVPEAPQ